MCVQQLHGVCLSSTYSSPSCGSSWAAMIFLRESAGFLPDTSCMQDEMQIQQNIVNIVTVTDQHTNPFVYMCEQGR